MADQTLMINFSTPEHFKAPKTYRGSFKARDKWAQKKQAAALKRKASGEHPAPPFKHKKPRHSDQTPDSQPAPLSPKSPQKHNRNSQSEQTSKHQSAPLSQKSPQKHKKHSQSVQTSKHQDAFPQNHKRHVRSEEASKPDAPLIPKSPPEQKKPPPSNPDQESPGSPGPQTPRWKQPRGGHGPQGKRSTPQRPSDRKCSDGSGTAAGGKHVIKTSSLFRNNPDIPSVQAPSVTQLKEKVFTTDSFSELDLHPHLVATLNKVLNVTSMTSVQKQTIPVLLAGKDAVVRSQTGSGKTLAYGIPIVQSLQAVEPKIKRGDGPLAVIVVPTRELAQQSFQIFQKLLKPFTWIVPGVLMGGEKRKAEKARLRKGINILVSTPGRLVDHINNTLSIVFSSVRWLILDEADRTLDLGFEKDLAVILNALNGGGSPRQNVLLSATLTEGLSRLADICMQDPVSVHVCEDGGSAHVPACEDGHEEAQTAQVCEGAEQAERFAVPESLQQHMVVVPSKLRLVCLAAFILAKCKFESGQKLIVFLSSCEAVEFLLSLLTAVLCGERGDDATPKKTKNKPAPNKPAPKPINFLRLHGNMKQEERMEVFQEFSQGKSGVLLCTDVAARGLDLPQVTWIIQYNPPLSAAEYVHRVGRTARIGAEGSSLLFLTPAEVAYVDVLANHNISLAEMKLEEILSVLMRDERFRGRGRWDHKKGQAAVDQEMRERATVFQTDFENVVHASEESVQTAKRALQSFVRAYTTYPSALKHIFHLRSLHLGHAAKSFGLRDAPRNLTQAPGENARKNKIKNKDNKRKPGMSERKRVAHLLCSEFGDGADCSVRKRRRRKGKTTEEETLEG
ncbi:probable ATP-dependent RNA helicase DDX31 [Alosa sapidissima]|uniref:probable ATP-dependent RNA helicase DDX31 n=1 Tax=Alosa sapidissima TaxID=34773 RepID=UPI001C096307|nr:probable ATP-dependent RNA helicase DDX31 [Alosa sapidissima]XP_041956487.1 probable ATP-dependent RNA helicase DDX31 [Alosa sapidissima]